MARREEYEAKAEALITPIIEANHFELVDMEYVKEGSNWYLRAYIDKDGGITVDDCELVSRAFSDLLDKEDFIEDSYIMEVSSPGLGRPLKKDKDFKRNIGNEVELRLYKAVNKVKEDVGILTAFDKDTVTIEHEDGTEAVYERSALALIRLTFDF
ncbi:MAG: ribosome maturation factor RimP [Lachnospiraceae bacterium]